MNTPVPFDVRYTLAALSGFTVGLNDICDALSAARGEPVIVDDRAYSDALASRRIRPDDHDDNWGDWSDPCPCCDGAYTGLDH